MLFSVMTTGRVILQKGNFRKKPRTPECFCSVQARYLLSHANMGNGESIHIFFSFREENIDNLSCLQACLVWLRCQILERAGCKDFCLVPCSLPWERRGRLLFVCVHLCFLAQMSAVPVSRPFISFPFLGQVLGVDPGRGQEFMRRC